MTTSIKTLEPSLLWDIFNSICSIPHPSGHEEALRDFLKAKALSAGLETEIDKTGNLLISKPASKGMEKARTVILQGHLDMVPQKNSNVQFDFVKDPIKPYITGDMVKAENTTLGADNGIGAAAAMAVLLDKNAQHGPLKALFTVAEEVGLTGALGLQADFLKADILLNLDSEEEGMVFIGCAGGIRSNHEFIPDFTPAPQKHQSKHLTVSGLKGGHSGCDINAGRGNAIKIMAELLTTASKRFQLKLADIHGGNLDNAIPREAFATVLLPQEAENFASFVSEFETEKRKFFSKAEPDLKISTADAAIPGKIFSDKFQKQFLDALNECPHGVISMSKDFPGIVETSTNLAAIKNDSGKITIRTSQRSPIEKDKMRLSQKICDLFAAAGAKSSTDCEYPGWEPKHNSKVLKTFCEVHKKLFGTEAEKLVIHAGLECGIIYAKNPAMEMLSFGPEIKNAHSPDEYTKISSVAKFWTLLNALLKALD